MNLAILHLLITGWQLDGVSFKGMLQVPDNFPISALGLTRVFAIGNPIYGWIWPSEAYVFKEDLQNCIKKHTSLTIYLSQGKESDIVESQVTDKFVKTENGNVGYIVGNVLVSEEGTYDIREDEIGFKEIDIAEYAKILKTEDSIRW